MDLAYIQQYSVWLDLKLILRTALVLLTPEESTEAFEDKKRRKNRNAYHETGGAAELLRPL